METVWIKDIDNRDRVAVGDLPVKQAREISRNLRWAGFDSWTEEV